MPFAAMGLFLTWMIVQTVREDMAIRAWVETPCHIMESEVREEPEGRKTEPYHAVVRYEYGFGGQEYESTRVTKGDATFASYSDADEIAQKYPAGSETYCLVNPENPAEAVLEPPTLWMALLIFFPLIFVAIGLGGIYAMWRVVGADMGGSRTMSGKLAPDAQKPLSERANKGTPTRFLHLFFGVFLLAGLGMLYGLVAAPLIKVSAARQWVETPCTIISSRVITQHGSDSTTYRVDILYRYTFEGREYRSSRYDFSVGSDSGFASKREIVRRHPPGAQIVCFVNPNKPSQAVIHRGLPRTLWWGLLGVLFAAVGGGGIFFTALHQRRLQSGQGKTRLAPISRVSSFEVRDDPGLGGSISLQPKGSPVGKLFGILAIALFWNGIISVFVWQVISGFRTGRPEWFLTIFMIPFVVVGAGLLLAIPYQFLSLWNPRPRLQISRRQIPLGGDLDLAWELAGRSHIVRKLEILIEGREEATYRRGTDTSTDRQVFLKIPILSERDPARIRSGSARVTIPADSMHSFSAPNNKIVWELKVKGDIRRWPDLAEDFDLEVLPHV